MLTRKPRLHETLIYRGNEYRVTGYYNGQENNILWMQREKEDATTIIYKFHDGHFNPLLSLKGR